MRCCRCKLAAFSYSNDYSCPCCNSGCVETPYHHIMCPAFELQRSKLHDCLREFLTYHDDSILHFVISLLFKRPSLLPTFVLSACSDSLASALAKALHKPRSTSSFDILGRPSFLTSNHYLLGSFQLYSIVALPLCQI